MDKLDVSNIYTGGFCDGVRELLDALRIAIDSAQVGERLPAIERVMEEYETEYRNAEYTKPTPQAKPYADDEYRYPLPPAI